MLHAAHVTASRRPHPTPHRSAFVSGITTATTISFVVFGAAGDHAVRVDDQ
jgi:hypothetical protein